MQDETQNRPVPADDTISLSYIRNIFLDFFSFLLLGLEFIVHSIRNYFLLFLFFCLAGLGIGYFLYLSKPVYYTSQMMVYSSDLTPNDYSGIVDNLNKLVFSQSYKELQEELHIDEEVAGNVLGLEAVKNNREPKKDTFIKAFQFFKIQVNLQNPVETKQLQQGLLQYLNNNPYSKLIKEGTKKIYESKLAFIDHELESLDTLKVVYNKALASSKISASFYNNAMNPADIYIQSNKLIDQKVQLERWLNSESQAVLLVDGFKKPLQVDSHSLNYFLTAGLAAGFLLGVAFSILAAIIKIVKRRRPAAV